MLYAQAIHYGTPYTDSLHYTAQYVYYHVYTGPHTHNIIHCMLYTYIHLLDTYTMSNAYTCIIYSREIHVHTPYIHTHG